MPIMSKEPDPRPRGFLTQKDREFLTTPSEDLEVQPQTIRKRKDRIRERVYNALLDFNYLSGLPESEHRTIFEKVRESWVNGSSGVALMRLFKTIYLGLKSVGMERRFEELLSRAVEQAEKEAAAEHGEQVDVSVSLNVEVRSQATADDLEDRLASGELLSNEERSLVASENDLSLYEETMMGSEDFQDDPEERSRSPLVEQAVVASPIPGSAPVTFDELYSDMAGVLVWVLRDDVGKEAIGFDFETFDDLRDDEDLAEIVETFDQLQDVEGSMPNPIIIQAAYMEDEGVDITEDQRLKEFVKIWNVILDEAGWKRPEGFDNLLETMEFDPTEYESERFSELLEAVETAGLGNTDPAAGEE